MDEPLGLVAESLREGQIVAEPLSFEAFFEAEARTLFRRLCAVTGNSAEAEEIMQDAFLALWERWTASARSRIQRRTCTGWR
jgi:DNA-directed RNA polymerase specialized sigma24 family protein